ncbi:MAG: hypothetical protein ACRDZO_20335 [Egibacteraceae bacterium]
MADPDFAVDVGGQGTVGRIVQAGVYNEAFRPVAKATFPQFVAVPDPNPLFVGRDDELTALDRCCGGDEPARTGRWGGSPRPSDSKSGCWPSVSGSWASSTLTR